MTAADPSKKFSTLLKKLRSKYDPASPMPLASEPGDGSDPLVQELVFSLLLWEASSTQARNGMKRLRENLCDSNELRVCMPDDIAAMLGEKYPLAHERSLRLRSSLNDVFHRTHALSLQHVALMPKREARAYLESLEGLPVFASHRVALLHGLAHALPMDERLRDLLADESVTEPETPTEQLASWLEKHIPAEDALSTYAVLQAWSDDQGHPPKRERKVNEFARLTIETPVTSKSKPTTKSNGKAQSTTTTAGASVSGASTADGASSGETSGKSETAARKPKKSRTKSGG